MNHRQLLVLAACATALLAGCGSSDNAARLPDARVARLDGGTREIGLRSFAGDPLVVNIWATWCVPCRREMPMFERVHTSMRGVRFIGITEAGDRDAALEFARSLGVTYDLLVDVSGDAFTELDAKVLPTTVFVDASGRVRARHLGALSERALRARVATLLGDESVR